MRQAMVVVALAGMTLLLVAGGLMLLRSRDMLQRIVAFDLLASIVIALLALLSYLRQTSYYLDAALALALLSFVSTLPAARHYAERPVLMVTVLLDIVAVGLLALGSIVTTISVYGALRMPDVYSQLLAAGMASGVGAIAILLASIATSDAATITDAVLVIVFLLRYRVTLSPGWHRRRASQNTRWKTSRPARD